MKIESGLHMQANTYASCQSSGGWIKKTRAGIQSFRSRFRALFGANEEGGALIEIALTLPVLLGVLTGVFSFGSAYSNQITLTQAVGAGGQYLQQIRNSTTDPCKDTMTAIQNAAPYFNMSNVVLTVTMNGVTPTQTQNSCPGAQTNLVAGQPVTVLATYPCNLGVYGVKFSNSCQLAAKVTEYEY